jgi:hypothetical protein
MPKTAQFSLKLAEKCDELHWLDSYWLHTVKESFAVFPSPARMSLTNLFLAGNKLIIPGLFIPGQEELGK